MLKRFYSKKSGFTLVEIIIAFAVFAIMASMICQMLDLAVQARRSNNAYQAELDVQEQILTLIKKNKDNYTGTVGNINLNFSDSLNVTLPYDRLSAKPDAEYSGEGLNYYLSPVDYQSDGMGGGGGTVADPSSIGSNGGSQASRMDTRITGTAGIANVQIVHVIKDTYNYPAGDPLAVPAGRTRYIIMCSASAGTSPQTLKDEDVPYSQYRLFFYHEPDPDNPDDKSYLDMAASSVEYTNEDGDTYTKEVPKAANITKVVYLNDINASTVTSTGLKSNNISGGVTSGSDNKFTIEKMSKNVIRIGSPFTESSEGKGVKFTSGKISTFYVEFDGDPHLTKTSFGKNYTLTDDGYARYTACPNYLDKYDDDGNPLYESSSNHVNIYGAYLYKRNYLN